MPKRASSSKNWITWTTNCTKLNWQKQKSNTRNLLLLSFSFFNMQNYGCWSSIKTFMTISGTSTISKIWKWIHILSTLLLLKKNWSIVFDQRWQQSGKICDQLTWITVLQRIRQELSQRPPNLLLSMFHLLSISQQLKEYMRILFSIFQLIVGYLVTQFHG